MAMRSKLFLALPMVLLSGCVNEPIAQRDPAVGEAVKYNAAVQTINPNPVYAEGSAQPGDHGEHGADAVQRYRQGTVTQPVGLGTTNSAGSPGGSGGPQ